MGTAVFKIKFPPPTFSWLPKALLCLCRKPVCPHDEAPKCIRGPPQPPPPPRVIQRYIVPVRDEEPDNAKPGFKPGKRWGTGD